MKDLLRFILESITGNKDFEIEETIDEGGFIRLTVHITTDYMGIVIGRNGNTIKAIRSLLRAKATLEKKGFTLSVIEKTDEAHNPPNGSVTA